MTPTTSQLDALQALFIHGEATRAIDGAWLGKTPARTAMLERMHQAGLIAKASYRAKITSVGIDALNRARPGIPGIQEAIVRRVREEQEEAEANAVRRAEARRLEREDHARRRKETAEALRVVLDKFRAFEGWTDDALIEFGQQVKAVVKV